MGTTPTYSWPYPEPTDPVANGAQDIEDLALAVESTVSGISPKILQIVSTSKVDQFTSTSGSFTDVTGLSATITPTSATSTILVVAPVSVAIATGYTGYLNLVRDSTDIAQSTGATSQNMTKQIVNYSGSGIANPTVVFEDSPATTLATTYKIQVRPSTAGQIFAVNRRATSAGFGAVSSITVMEVSA